jgi:hypothetical protein
MIKHILVYKTALNKLKKLNSYELHSLITMKLNKNAISEGYLKKSTNILKLNQSHINNSCIKEYHKNKIKFYFEINGNSTYL